MPHVAGHQPTQLLNPEALRTDLPPGIAAFGEIARQRAIQGGQQFEDLAASGRFDDNPLALEFVNRGLGTRGEELIGGQVVPQTGLIGGENVLKTGFQEGGGEVTGGETKALDFLGQGQETFDPFLQSGFGAQQAQAAASGALGPEAQAEFFRNFQESPNVEFLRQRGEKGIEAQAGRFGAFGGNFQKGLSQFNQGLALQDLDRQLGQLQQVAGRGFGAAQGIAGLATAKAGVSERAAGNRANLRVGLARDLSSGRIRAGELIAEHIANITSAVAAGEEALGSGLTNLLGSGATAVANLLQSSGLTAAQQDETLALILANLAVQEGSNVADFSTVIGGANALGIAGSSDAVNDAVIKILSALDLGGGTE